MMMTGLCAFPLTPIAHGKVDEDAFIQLIHHLAAAGVDAIGALGSTGSYAYLTRQERQHLAKVAVDQAGGIPVMVSIGAIRLDEVLALAEAAQQAGVSAVMMAPVSYQRLKPDEVLALYEAVTRQLSVPLCIYDNPGTTGFSFTDDLLGRSQRCRPSVPLNSPRSQGHRSAVKRGWRRYAPEYHTPFPSVLAGTGKRLRGLPQAVIPGTPWQAGCSRPSVWR